MVGVAFALISAICWGTSSVLIKVGLKNRSPLIANLVRLIFSSLMYATIFLIGGNFNEIFRMSLEYHIIAFVSAQFGFVIGDYLYFSALKSLGVSRTVPITSTYPLWTLVWAYLFLGREITIRIAIGALMIVLGIIVVRQVEVEEHVNPKGLLYAFLTPISWSMAIILMDWLSNKISPLTLAGLRIMYATVGITISSLKVVPELKHITKREVMVIATAGMLGLVVAQYTFVSSVSMLGSQIATPITAINPIISTLLAITFLKEPPNWKIWVSLGLVVSGIWLLTS
ncbi:permease [Thermococcus chitonophagus]|uniref:Permease n=1 Tax=Thermococcus chitonophagus TaxID=54262 RepID=A0A2Z2N7K3_9EURY|nr:permease [Thermococcus chitonophagus]